MSSAPQMDRADPAGEPCFVPGAPLAGELCVPGSKSIAQRALLAACFARRASAIQGALGPADVEGALRLCATFGAHAVRCGEGSTIALEPRQHAPGGSLECGESGTAARLGLALAALAAPAGTEFELRPEGSLLLRSSEPLLRTLKRAGLRLWSTGPQALELGLESLGPRARRLQLREPGSSQEVSALLLGLAASGGGRLEVRGRIPSEPYVHLTRGVLRRFGAPIRFELGRGGRSVFDVPAGGLTGGPFGVEADASAGAVGLVALALTGGQGSVRGFTRRSGQPDAAVADCLTAMGCEVRVDGGAMQVAGRPQRGARLDFGACPDLAPAMAAAAGAVALGVPGDAGRSSLTGLETLPGKESSRIEVLGRGLRALGLGARWDDRSLEVWQASPPPHAQQVVLDACGDHRMVFAFALLSLVRPGIRVQGTAAVAKSWPGFFQELERLGASRPLG